MTFEEKEEHFIGELKKDDFDEIKRQLQKPPVLYMPDNEMRFHLYSDTSKFTTGSTLYQI